MAPKKPKPAPSRYWIFDPKDKTRVICLKSSVNDCLVIKLWEAKPSPFHDRELQEATAAINRILKRVEESNDDPSRHACFIKFRARLMLVWSHHDRSVASQDDPPRVAKALKVKKFTRVT